MRSVIQPCSSWRSAGRLGRPGGGRRRWDASCSCGGHCCPPWTWSSRPARWPARRTWTRSPPSAAMSTPAATPVAGCAGIAGSWTV
ncbi:Os10g0497750 [Oryza sativa Japonica Group]|uniref:Os10g0497750 protein n=1 Tax=Oryza sativa subsp. japonica TaxID=39947 RepID=A0A0P0XW49_ORYSJ|nr:Os10g0497750 [Oryza sativa Japonica Group]